MLIDLFTHTHRSPGGALEAEAIVRRAREAGLDGVCIIDREHSRDAGRWVELGAREGLFVGVGVEILTDIGCLIGLPAAVDQRLEHEHWRKLTLLRRPGAQEVIDHFTEHGGAVIAASLFDQHAALPMGDQVFTVRGLHAVDVLNPGRSAVENDLALEVSVALRLSGVGGSRALTSTAPIGKAATIFASPVHDQASLVGALRGRDFWAVNLDASGEAPGLSGGGERRSEGRDEERDPDGGRRRRSSRDDRRRQRGDRAEEHGGDERRQRSDGRRRSSRRRSEDSRR